MLSFLFLFSSIFINCNGQDPCPSHECNGVEIKYPFWQIDGTTSEQFCGYPGFGLNCSNTNQNPVLNLPKDSYYVSEIDYDNFTLNLIDIDVVGAACPRVRHNFSAETLPIYYQTDSNLNLTFYFNCSSAPPPPLLSTPIGCLASRAGQSYVVEATIDSKGFDHWYDYCQDKVEVAAEKTSIKKNDVGGVSGFRDALNEGFLLNWKILKECLKCEESDGRCGYNNTAKESLCFCQDNSTRTNNESCKDRCKCVIDSEK
ncbi:hypothetical protein AgCh_008200 [Apium graveolens]